MISADIARFMIDMPQTLSLDAESQIIHAVVHGQDNTSIHVPTCSAEEVEKLIRELDVNGYQIISSFRTSPNMYVVEIAW